MWSAAAVALPTLQALIRPVLHNDRVQCQRVVQVEHVADLLAELETALYQHLIVSPLYEFHRLLPVQLGSCCDAVVDTPALGQRIIRQSLGQLASDSVHLVVQFDHPLGEDIHMPLPGLPIDKPAQPLSQPIIVQLLNRPKCLFQQVLLLNVLRVVVLGDDGGGVHPQYYYTTQSNLLSDRLLTYGEACS